MHCFPSLFASFATKQKKEVAEEFSGIENTKLYSYKELRRATGDFSPANKIGEGGFGSVFKGTLKDGTVAAIKVLSAESRQGVKEFLTEITIIANIKHESLVTLYGCCVEGNHRILVYGFLENNSLSQTLLDRDHCGIEFSWDTRRRICIDVAKGLSFLHENVRPYVVHRDIKASNILLNENLTAKIADFGLAKLFPAHMTHISTRVAGTAGYLAPEYAIRGQLTTKADIYSFGVLILEIVSGRCNTSRYLPPEERFLLERAWELYENGKLVNLIDKSMNDDFNVDEACRYLKIGLLCTQDVPKLRPSMSTVVNMLTGQLDIEGKKISRPGLLTEFMGYGLPNKYRKEHEDESKDSSYTVSSSSGKAEDSSFTSGGITSSFATMNFDSIYNRTY